jgi:hypothetical protein
MVCSTSCFRKAVWPKRGPVCSRVTVKLAHKKVKPKRKRSCWNDFNENILGSTSVKRLSPELHRTRRNSWAALTRTKSRGRAKENGLSQRMNVNNVTLPPKSWKPRIDDIGSGQIVAPLENYQVDARNSGLRWVAIVLPSAIILFAHMK